MYSSNLTDHDIIAYLKIFGRMQTERVLCTLSLNFHYKIILNNKFDYYEQREFDVTHSFYGSL